MQDSRIKFNRPICSQCNLQFDQYYHVPRVIPKCGHTFCQKCISNKLQTKLNRKVFICSSCQSETIIRKSVADEIPKNISMIDIVKNIKKQEYQDKQFDKQAILNLEKSNTKKQKKDICKIHNKQLDLICQTCSNMQICSHCSLLKDNKLHQGHKLIDKIAASEGDVQDLKQTFNIISDSIKQTILPNSPHNIIKQSENALLQGLKDTVHNHFKKYYKIIQKKQMQLISQCQQIRLEGGIHHSVDRIIKSYDIIKNSYNQTASKNNSKLSLDFIQQFVKGCKDLHNQMVELQQYVQNQSKKLLTEVSNRISQSVQFKITQLSFSLKNLLQCKMESPNKLNKSKFEQFKPASIKQKSKDSKVHKSVIQTKNKDKKQYSSFQFISNNNQHPKTNAPLPRQKVQIQKINASHQSIEQNLSTKQIQTLDLKRIQKRNVKSSFATQRVNKTTKQDQISKKKYLQRPTCQFSQVISSRITNLSTKSQKNQPQDQKLLKLKQVRPTKQIAFEFKNKFQAIINEIDRQSTNSTLQLIGMEINDAIMVHVVQYLRTHKLKFVMIKLVKNLLTDEGIAPLLGYLSHDNETQVLNLTSNSLTSKCLDLIVQFGQKNSFLKTISLTNNKISAFQLKGKKKQLDKHQIQVIV